MDKKGRIVSFDLNSFCEKYKIHRGTIAIQNNVVQHGYKLVPVPKEDINQYKEENKISNYLHKVIELTYIHNFISFLVQVKNEKEKMNAKVTSCKVDDERKIYIDDDPRFLPSHMIEMLIKHGYIVEMLVEISNMGIYYIINTHKENLDKFRFVIHFRSVPQNEKFKIRIRDNTIELSKGKSKKVFTNHGGSHNLMDRSPNLEQVDHSMIESKLRPYTCSLKEENTINYDFYSSNDSISKISERIETVKHVFIGKPTSTITDSYMFHIMWATVFHQK